MPAYRRLIIAWLFVPMHRLLFRLSGGRLLSRLDGVRVLILVTKGRKSGKRRSSPLLYFPFEGSDDFIVVASNYGQDHHPAWYWNIVADPTSSPTRKFPSKLNGLNPPIGVSDRGDVGVFGVVGCGGGWFCAGG